MKGKKFLVFLGLGLALLVGACSEPTTEVEEQEGTEEVQTEGKEEVKEKEGAKGAE